MRQFDISKLIQLVFVNLVSIFVVYVAFKDKESRNYRCQGYLVNWKYICILIFCLLPFVFFLNHNVKSFDLEGLASFAIMYRQGFYQGSGFYTFLSIQVLPLFVAYCFYKRLINNYQFFLGVTIISAVCFILGLRIFLYPLVLIMFMEFGDKFSFRKALMLFLVMISFTIYKNYLGNKTDFLETALSQITRPDLHAIVVSYSDVFFVKESFTTLPIVRFFFNENIGAFKNAYINEIPLITTRMPFIRSFQGVAIPGYVLFFNSLNLLALAPLVFILVLIKFLTIKLKQSRGTVSGLCYFYALIIVVGSLLEDVGFLYRLEYFFLIFIIMVSFYKFSWSKKSQK